MRVLITGINWPPETFIRRLIGGLLERGIAVTVGAPNRPDDTRIEWLHTPTWEGTVLRRGLRIAQLCCGALARGSRDVRVFNRHVGEGSVTSLRQWYRLLPYAGRRWDVIYFPWNTAAISCLPLFELGIPVIVSCRGSQISVAPHNPARSELRQGLERTFKAASAVHCVSESTLSDACELGLDRTKGVVIRPAVDTSKFQPSAREPRNTFNVVSVGNLVWVKGHEWALMAARKLVDEGVPLHLSIIGSGEDYQRLLYTISDLRLEKHVSLLGKLSPELILKKLQVSDAFLLTSHSEGISNAALEAMACGLPVVTTSCGGMSEAVRDRVDGFVVPVRNAGAIADALGALAWKSSLQAQMGQNARQRAVGGFDLKRQMDLWMKLLRGVAGQSN